MKNTRKKKFEMSKGIKDKNKLVIFIKLAKKYGVSQTGSKKQIA